MKTTFFNLKSRNKEGFALGYVLVIIGAAISICGFLLISSFAENKQSILHAKNITSYYTAESGAQVAHLAFKEYIHALNQEITQCYCWNDIQEKDNYLELLCHGILGPCEHTDKVIFHLNLTADNDYYLNYSKRPIINIFSENSCLEARITLRASCAYCGCINEYHPIRTFPIKYTIECKGLEQGALANQNLIQGEGSAFISFYRGSFARFALFTDDHKDHRGYDTWFNDRTIFTGPVFSNSTLQFDGNPYFKGPVKSVSSTALFKNNGTQIYLDASSNPPHDIPIFEQGFQRGVQKEYLPSHLPDLRQVNLQHDVNNPPQSDDYHLPIDSNNKLVGGLYLPKETEIELRLDGSKQVIRTTITRGLLQLNRQLDFILDYEENTTTVYDRRTKKNVAVYDSLFNGTILVDSNIPNIYGWIHSSSRLTIAAKNEIRIGDHIRYQDNPLENPQAINLLGLLSERADIVVPNNGAPNNLVIHGILMAPNGSFRVHDNNIIVGDRGDITLLGGTITKYYGGLGYQRLLIRHGYGRNFIYDERMSDIRQAPLGFPTTESLEYETTRANNIDSLDLIIWRHVR